MKILKSKLVLTTSILLCAMWSSNVSANSESEQRQMVRSCLDALENWDGVISRTRHQGRELQRRVADQEIKHQNLRSVQNNLQVMEQNARQCNAYMDPVGCNNRLQQLRSYSSYVQNREAQFNREVNEIRQLFRQVKELEDRQEPAYARMDRACGSAEAAGLPIHLWRQEVPRYHLRTNEARDYASRMQNRTY